MPCFLSSVFEIPHGYRSGNGDLRFRDREIVPPCNVRWTLNSEAVLASEGGAWRAVRRGARGS